MTTLYHVGCGTALFDSEQADGMALACRCGADAPIVVADLEDESGRISVMPASLYAAASNKERQVPHIEYYLGFSEFDCPAKRAIEAGLREMGAVSFSECPEPRCQDEPERQRQREAHFAGMRNGV